MQVIKRSFIIILFLAASFFCWSRHIIGSDFYYECNGDGKLLNSKSFTFNLNVYRDCNTPILFNPNAAFGIYSYSLAKGYTFVDQLTINHGKIFNVKTTQNPCVSIPSNICVEATEYAFTVDLPVINETYIIYYVQCCRNLTILNISDPGNSGATFFIEITPEAQLICNNSPRFKSIPPIVICADFPLNFDHSSIDKDGDSLTYEFCSLFAGGGPGGGVVFPGTVGACQSPTPDPRACPPPFVLLNLVAGFSFADPLGQGILKLNETNGLLTGLPLDLGQFVVGICVKEFRNGKLIGSIRREFQFNVSACDQFNSGINSPSKSEFFKVEPNSSIVFDVLLNDSITSGNPISVIIEKPQYGSIIYSQLTGKGTYTPNNRFFGKEILMYKVCPMGCIDACRTSTVEFDVLPPCSDRNSLVLPNVIFPDSPSGDNRYFIVEALKDCPDAFGPKPTKLTVFNRWGDLIYRNDDYKNDWEGTNTQGQPLPTGTYYYLLDLGSVSAPIKGYVVVMR